MQLTSAGNGKKIRIWVRIILGGVFLASCIDKIAHPAAFAAVVANYQVLPPALVATTAVVFPWIEALCGLALVCGRFVNGAVLLVCLMMITFIGVTAYNTYRGLNVACGCFSLASSAPTAITLVIGRDLAILAAAAWLLMTPSHDPVPAKAPMA